VAPAVTAERRPEPGELCRCGRPAVVVYLAGHGEVPWCGPADSGGAIPPENPPGNAPDDGPAESATVRRISPDGGAER